MPGLVAERLVEVADLGYVPLLRRMYRVVLPGAVVEELFARPDAFGSGVVSLDRVSHRAPRTENVHRVLEITGTLGILLRLHRLGLVSRSLEEDLQLLEEAGMRISPELRRAVLESDV